MAHIRAWRGRIAGMAMLSLSGLACLSTPAAAVGLYTGASYTFDGLTLSVTGCTLTGVSLAGLPAGSCGTTDANSYLTLAGTAGANAIFNLTKTGGGDIFSYASGTNTTYDVNFTLKITAAKAVTKVNSAALAVNGSSSAGTLKNQVTATETFLAPIPAGATNLATSLVTTSATTAFTSAVSPLSTPLNVTGDLKLLTGTTLGTTLKLTSAMLTYGPAPEPLSIGIFMIGLAGLGAARHRMKTRG